MRLSKLRIVQQSLLHSRDSNLAVGDSEATVRKPAYHHRVLSVDLWSNSRGPAWAGAEAGSRRLSSRLEGDLDEGQEIDPFAYDAGFPSP